MIDNLSNSYWITQTLWDCTSVTWDDPAVPTAAVFIKGGKPQLSINTAFWSKLNDSEKSFIIDHEMLHIILDHHKRFEKEMRDNGSQAVNVACDLAINSILLNTYDKQDLPFLYKEICTPEAMGMPEGKSADWYLSMSYDMNGGYGRPKKSKIGNDIEKIDTDSVDDETAAGIEAGQEKGKQCKEPEFFNSTGKKPFVSFLKEVTKAGSVLSQGFTQEEKWGWPDRRTIEANDLLIKGRRWNYAETKMRRTKLLIYCDVSGSCTSYSRWFVSAIKAIPDRFFEKDVWYFDTQLSKEFKYGGGTAFHIFESHYATLDRKPDSVFVLTDGQGTGFKCPDAKNWHWFMTPNSTTRYVDKVSKVLALSDYSYNM